MRTPADPLDLVQGVIDAIAEFLRPPATRNTALVFILGAVFFATRAAILAPVTVGHTAATAIMDKEKQLDDVWRETIELRQAREFFEHEGKPFARDAIYQRLGRGEVLIQVDPSEPAPEGSAQPKKSGWVRRPEESALRRKQLIDHWVHARPIPQEEETEEPEGITTTVSEDRLRELIDEAVEANEAAQTSEKGGRSAPN